MLLNDEMDATAWPGSHCAVLQCYDNRNVSLGKNGPTVHRLQACRSYESHLMTRMTCLASFCFAPKILMVSISVGWQKCRNSTEAAMWNNIIYFKSLFLGEASTDRRLGCWWCYWQLVLQYWVKLLWEGLSHCEVWFCREAHTPIDGLNPQDKLRNLKHTLLLHRLANVISLDFVLVCCIIKVKMIFLDSLTDRKCNKQV